jgi:ABC-type uncharacterized transport system, periplasmic component
MNRRRFLLLAGATATGMAVAGPAVASRGRRRIYMVVPQQATDTEIGFQEFLTRRNIEADFILRPTHGDPSRIAAIIEEIKTVRPDLVYTWGTPTTLAIFGPYDGDPERYVMDIPGVFATVTDPIASRLVTDLDHPNRNVTGVVHLASLEVQLNTISAYRDIRSLGIIYNPHEENAVLTMKKLTELTAARGIQLLPEAVPIVDGKPNGDAIPHLVERIAKQEADFLYIGPDTFVAVANGARLTAAAIQHRLPTFSATESIVRRSNALVGLFSSAISIGRFSAFKAEQILVEGRSPREVPIETLRRFSLLINMRVARQIEVYPPIGLLSLAEVLTD